MSDEAQRVGGPLSIVVPGAARLQNGETTRFPFQRAKLPEEGFVLRYAGELYAFANSCPHWSVDLDYGMGDFYDVSLDRIVCKNHGALFHPTSGLCEWGPCVGRSIERFELAVTGEDVVVAIPPSTPGT